MKTCLKCGNQNSDEMAFCLQCGAPIAAQTAQTWQPSAQKTASFSTGPPTALGGLSETQTFVRSSGLPSPPPEKNNTKLIVGGAAAALLLLLLVFAGGGVGYYYYTRSPVAANRTPSGSPAASPGTSPSSAPTPQPGFTPPIEPTKAGKFTVYANGGWQLSAIDTVGQEEFRTQVDGKADIAGVKTGISSAGVTDPASVGRRVYPEFATGALLMRTHYADGKFSNVAAVSGKGTNGSWRNYPDETGRLEFCVNDKTPEQNGGQFTISVTLTKAPKPKK